MTYVKPENIRYVDMCIWIDEHAYLDDCPEDTLYEYLYHICIMLAQKGSLFKTSEEYDNFGLYMASRLFLRLHNPQQYELKPDGTPKLKQVKSILNYIKNVLYLYKVDYDIEFTYEPNLEVLPVSTYNLGSYLVDETNIYDQLEFSSTLGSITTIVRAHLQKIPYKKDSSEWMNIYTSCLLTLLSSFTLSNYQIKYYQDKKFNKFDYLVSAYQEQKYRDPVLYHLPDSMKNYIVVLVNELRHVLASELSWKANTYISSEETMRGLMATAFEKEES